MKLICFLKGIWRSLITFNIISGHNYKEIYDNKDIQVLECEVCGQVSVGFKENKKIEKIKILNSDDENDISTLGVTFDFNTIKNKINEIIDYINNKD